MFQSLSHPAAFLKDGFVIKMLAVVLLIGFIVSGNPYGQILHDVLVEAYLAVAVFVTMTLVIIYGLEKFFKFDLGYFNRTHPHTQVPVAAGLGALPGCGGAIVVLTQYVSGHISFGSVVAVLISTMGDAAFLLIAQAPATAGVVIVLSIIVGTITGFIVDMIHGRDFMAVKQQGRHFTPKTIKSRPTWLEDVTGYTAFIIFVPGIVLGVMMAFQMELPVLLEETVGFMGAVSMLLVWVYLKDKNPMVNYTAEIKDVNLVRRAMDETAFILVWVIAAFFLYEAVVHAFDIDLKAAFSHTAWLLPLFGVLIGFIPGCGPQILVTTLYLNGIVPLSAQLGNAISNDGDALFPAIALAPRAAILATLYSGIPAVIIAYGYFFLFE